MSSTPDTTATGSASPRPAGAAIGQALKQAPQRVQASSMSSMRPVRLFESGVLHGHENSSKPAPIRDGSTAFRAVQPCASAALIIRPTAISPVRTRNWSANPRPAPVTATSRSSRVRDAAWQTEWPISAARPSRSRANYRCDGALPDRPAAGRMNRRHLGPSSGKIVDQRIDIARGQFGATSVDRNIKCRGVGRRVEFDFLHRSISLLGRHRRA